MRLTRLPTPGRFGGGLLALALTAVIAGGCSKPAADPAGKADPKPGNSTGPAGKGGQAPADPVGEAATTAAEFLAAVRSGTASPGRLSPEFKAVLADPGAGDARAEWAAEQWLKGLAGKVPAGPVKTTDVAPDVAVGAAGSTRLRLVKAAGGWAVDWVQVGPSGPVGEFGTPGPQAAAGFATGAFLDAVLAGDHRLAEAVLSPAAKARVAPAFPGEAEGFNRTRLRFRLDEFRGTATGSTGPKATASGTGGTAAGELTGPGDKRPFALKLVPGPRPGVWLVDDFEAK